MSNKNLIGVPWGLIPTPALVIDIGIMEKNIETMGAYLKRSGMNIRPHGKTHKSPMIARMQMDAGAVGICCATVGEAEAMIYGGLKQVMMTSQVAGDEKIRRIVNLARNSELIVAVDSPENLEDLSSEARKYGVTLGVVIEIDVGMDRCGVRGIGQAVELARKAHLAEGISFRGIFGYEGQAVFIENREERTTAGRTANRLLVEAAESIRSAGIPVEIVSAAGTGTYDIAGEYTGITDIQAGSYLFMDGTYAKLGLPFEQALTVLATVISRPAEDVFILDVGMKGISAERFCPAVMDAPNTEILKLSEAHSKGIITGGACDPLPGDKVHLVPSHCCSTVSMYNEMYIIRNGKVEAIWPVTARGPY